MNNVCRQIVDPYLAIVKVYNCIKTKRGTVLTSE